MTYTTHYQDALKEKVETLKVLLLDKTKSAIPSPDFSLEALETTVGINQLYEYYTIEFDKRIGIITSVSQTPWGPVFLRRQLEEDSRSIAADALSYRTEHYKIKALLTLKVAFDYIDLFVHDKSKKAHLKKAVHHIFLRYQSVFDDTDGNPQIAQCLTDFRHAIYHVFHRTLFSYHFDRYFNQLAVWTQLSLPPHDFITLDEFDNTFEMATNASYPTETMYIEMAVLTYWLKYKIFPTPSQLVSFLSNSNRLSGLELSDIERFFDKKGASLLAWFHALPESNQAITLHYASTFLNGFISSPVQLSESIYGQKDAIFPAPIRNFFINLNGWLETNKTEPKVHISGAHIRSGAASREGHVKTTHDNVNLILSAAETVAENAQLSSAALLTDAITTFSKFRCVVGKSAEPDTLILDAHEEAESVLSDRMKLRITSIIMKGFSERIGRPVQYDPFNMLPTFQSLSLDKVDLTASPILSKPYGLTLLKAYQSIQSFVNRFYDTPSEDTFDTFISPFVKAKDETSECLRELKKIYADTKDTDLINHIRLLESIYTYTLLHLNDLKKRLFGIHASPVIKTVLEHAAPNQDTQMADQHYHQWMLALESIIGIHLPLLNELRPIDAEPIKAVITSYYCKDGRDRTSLIATLIKTLYKMYDTHVSTLANSDRSIDSIDIQPLSMIPITSLDLMTYLFIVAHDRVIDDFSSAMICGSPQSAMGDYGLLSKLFGAGLGFVSSAVPPIREGLRRITLPSAIFSNPHYHRHSLWNGFTRHHMRHMKLDETEPKLLSLPGIASSIK